MKTGWLPCFLFLFDGRSKSYFSWLHAPAPYKVVSASMDREVSLQMTIAVSFENVKRKGILSNLQQAVCQVVINWSKKRCLIALQLSTNYGSPVKCVVWKQNKGLYTCMVWLSKIRWSYKGGIDYKIKCRKGEQIPYLSVFYKQLIPISASICKLFSYNLKPIHGLLASKRRPIGLQ